MNRLFFIYIHFILFSISLQAQNIKLVFRYDDFMLKSNSLDEKVLIIFQKHRIPLVLGVIPCDSKENMILEKKYKLLPVLKQDVSDQSIEIAQHGLTHQKLIVGEFETLEKNEQYRRMFKGKFLLDSIFHTKVVTFIPPWNSYDSNTLDVMSQTGIKVLSSALCVGQSWSNVHVNYFPETIEDFSTLLTVLEHNKSRKGVVVVMFHNYTFGKRYSLVQLDSLLATINTLSYLKCVTFAQLYNNGEVSGTKRLESNMEINLLSKLFHLNGVIQTTSFATLIRFLNLFLYLFLSAFIYLLSIALIYRKKHISNEKKYFIGSVLLSIVGVSVWFHLFGPLKLIFIVAMISGGFLLALKIQFKK